MINKKIIDELKGKDSFLINIYEDNKISYDIAPYLEYNSYKPLNVVFNNYAIDGILDNPHKFSPLVRILESIIRKKIAELKHVEALYYRKYLKIYFDQLTYVIQLLLLVNKKIEFVPPSLDEENLDISGGLFIEDELFTFPANEYQGIWSFVATSKYNCEDINLDKIESIESLSQYLDSEEIELKELESNLKEFEEDIEFKTREINVLELKKKQLEKEKLSLLKRLRDKKNNK